MSFYRVRSLDELNCGSFNIKEPDMTKEYTQADDAVLLDSSDMTIDEVVSLLSYPCGLSL